MAHLVRLSGIFASLRPLRSDNDVFLRWLLVRNHQQDTSTYSFKLVYPIPACFGCVESATMQVQILLGRAGENDQISVESAVLSDRGEG